jgi:hypothetical protein
VRELSILKGLKVEWLVASSGELNIQPSLTMRFQLQELPAKFSGVTYGVAGIAAAIVIIARLTRRPNVSEMNKTTHSR